jgi:arabinan endo-1,5-alpha-L-arabinosidase
MLLKFYCGLIFLALTGEPALALEGMLGIHDPSTVIMCDGNYYVYGTGRGVSVLTSSNGFDWQRGQRIFDTVPASVKSYVPQNDGSGVWTPDIIRVSHPRRTCRRQATIPRRSV